MAERRNGRTGEWQNGGMAERRNGRTEEWQNGGEQNGGMAEWRNEGMVKYSATRNALMYMYETSFTKMELQ